MNGKLWILVPLLMLASCSNSSSSGQDLLADVTQDAGDLAADDSRVDENITNDDLGVDIGSNTDAGSDAPEVEDTSVSETVGDSKDVPEPDNQTPDVTDDDTGDPGDPWGACPDYVDTVEGVQCGYFPVPLDHTDPEKGTIDIFVFRVPATKQEGKRQVWFLQGGPGGSGADFAPIFAEYAEAHPEWELLSLDHRGVGNSARLTCSQEKSQWGFDYEGCVEQLLDQWGEGLGKFNTTQAAYDLGLLVDLLGTPDVPVFVYGASYGTYWALRYLQLFPNQAAGTILDSICSPGACKLDEYDYNFNENGRLLMQACLDDTVCAGKLGSIDVDPWKVVEMVFQKADDGTLCGGQFPMIDRSMLRFMLGFAEMDRAFRQLVPALIYRLYRCDANDQEALMHMFMLFQEMGGGATLGQPLPNYEDLEASATLGTNIINSELIGTKTLAEVNDIVGSAFFSTDAAPFMVEIATSGKWPVYPDDGYMNRFGETTQPLLMFNGTLDPQTTLGMAQPTGDYYKGTNQTFVVMPDAPHGVVFTSLTVDGVSDYLNGTPEYLTSTCGYQMMQAFIADPTQDIDMSCMGELSPIDFSNTSEANEVLSILVFGTDDMYDGTVQTNYYAQMLLPRVNPLPVRMGRSFK